MRAIASRLADARRHEHVESRLTRDSRIERWLAGADVRQPPTVAELRSAGYEIVRATR